MDIETGSATQKQKARELLEGPRGNYLIAQAFHYYCEHAPDTSNREDMAVILETLWPQRSYATSPSIAKPPVPAATSESWTSVPVVLPKTT